MPKCPKCGKEIDYLHHYAYYLQRADFWVNEEGKPIYDNWDDLADVKGNPEFECPECGEVLFTKEEDAINFLTSKPKKPQTQ